MACLDLSHVWPAHLHATLYQQLSERSNLTVMIEEADKHAYLSGSLPSLLKAYMLLTELIASRPESEIDIKQSLDFQKDNPLMVGISNKINTQDITISFITHLFNSFQTEPEISRTSYFDATRRNPR